jgi:peptide/nickel transport system ATP-binding protein
MSRAVSDLVTLENIEVHFEDSGLLGREPEVVKAVDDVSLTIGENEVLALVGESGCGKTTLGKTAVGLQRPTGGTIRYRGQDIWEAKEGVGNVSIPYRKIRRSLQIIHQDPGSSLNPNRTVLANMTVPLNNFRSDLTPSQTEQIVHKFLERLGITPAENYANRFPHQLSGGEQQRVVLARAMLMEPDLVLADEAVSALDVSLRVEMMDLMLELQEMFNTSYLFISHDFANARYLAKKADGRIGVMYLGKLVEVGSADEILQNPKHPYTKTLVWSTPSLDPDVAEAEIRKQPPVRTADIPDPKNPPGGCNFHTRCPKVIPPDDIDIHQRTYNEIMTLRHAIDDRTLEDDRLFESVGVDPEKEGERREHAAAFVSETLSEYFEGNLTGAHRGRVEDALEAVAVGEWETASSTLSEPYASVCERTLPDIDSSADHPVACHLYEDAETVAPEPTPTD